MICLHLERFQRPSQSDSHVLEEVAGIYCCQKKVHLVTCQVKHPSAGCQITITACQLCLCQKDPEELLTEALKGLLFIFFSLISLPDT